ncbi:caspase family protein [Variovorax paradoxus]|uniref:caspase family protein n=1 Tax=Variovorax paradoxus TaxID=34073 RepID=UPI003ECC2D69
MALLVDKRVPGEPGVHALLIGVGRYPYLQPDHELGEFAPDAGLKELTSPLHSVEAFADWIEADLRVSGAPLRSLRLLASSPDKQTPWLNSEPTFDNIQKYIRAWFKDVNSHEDNLALFYFCGHGLRVGDVHALLAQDFGSNSDVPFDHAFEPERFAGAMVKAKARRQIYLIDACSTRVPLPEDYEKVQPRSVITPATNNNLGIVRPVYIRASEFGTKAYGVVNAPSLFMTAFLEAMKGAAAAKQGATQWVVKTDRLKTALDWLIQRRPDGEGQEVMYGAGFSSAVDFHELPGAPLVPVKVLCQPEDFEAFSCLHVDQAEHFAAGQSPWNVDLIRGPHDFEAIETGSGASTVHGQALAEYVSPPYETVFIPCEDKP